MKNVFLLGNGFDLHHMLPTKYYDFMCVAEYLMNNILISPLNAGEIFSKCEKSANVISCYNAHKEVFDHIEVDFEEANRIIKLLKNNVWFKYFLKTLDADSAWIDFEKEISIVINTLDKIINQEAVTINLIYSDLLSAFVLDNFRFFIDISDDTKILHIGKYKIKQEYLKEYPCNSNILIVNKEKIFDVLFKQLIDFSKALNIYLGCFIENAFHLLHKDYYINRNRINLINLADDTISFNYTHTLERFYFNKKAYHIHGSVGKDNIVLGVSPNKLDDKGTDNTFLIKFKKYYQREVFSTANEYIKWYKENIVTGLNYRVITIGHSLDETDKDILSDLFLNAKEIYITYYDESCKDDYIRNIIKIFGNDGYNKLKKEQGLEFITLSDIEKLNDKIAPVQVGECCLDACEEIVII